LYVCLDLDNFAKGGKLSSKTGRKVMYRLTKSTLLALVLLFGVELGNLYSMQLANNMPDRQTFDSYFGVLSPLAVKFYIYHYQHLKVNAIS
jgi:uncharacterized membrane protein YsdA (DUF1294 family)